MNKQILKPLSFLPVLVATTLMGAAAFFTAQPGVAQTAKYICDTSGQDPRTMANTPQGQVTILRWTRTVGDLDPQKRCQIVSERFQTLHQQGALRFLTSGRQNGQNIICVAAQRGGACLPNGLLFTLKPGASPRETIRQMVNLSRSATRTRHIDETNARIYVSFDELLSGNVQNISDSPNR
jgi:hypothetical protein